MKKKLYEKLLVISADKLVKDNVNQACLWTFHQRKLPRAAEKLKKV